MNEKNYKKISAYDVVSNPEPADIIPTVHTTADGTRVNRNIPFSTLKGEVGPEGPVGPQGPKGDIGPGATVTVGTTTTVDAGTDAAVTNSGSASAAILNFTIPRGPQGPQGPQGVPGESDPEIVASKLSRSGDSMTGILQMGNNRITGLGAGTGANDAVNKAQLDAVSALAVGSAYTVIASAYGAVGNGTTNDTAALQDALNALDARGGGALDLEGKTYNTQRLSLKPNVGIINGNLRLMNGTNDYVISFDGHATRYQSNWFLDNVYIDCNAANNTTTAGGVISYATGAIYDRPVLRNVKIVNARTAAIDFTGNGTTMTIQPRLLFVTIDGNNALSGSRGIHFSNKVYDASLVSVDVGRQHIGIHIEGAAKIRFTDVRAWGCEDVGMNLTNVVDFAGVSCEFDKNFGHGVYVYQSTRIHFIGSAFTNNSFDDVDNEFGLGAGHGTANTKDGLFVDQDSEVFVSASRFGNEGMPDQRYGITVNNNSTAYTDGLNRYFGNATGATSGNVKGGQNIGMETFTNGSIINPETATRTNYGFYSDDGAGLELYKYSDVSNPGKIAMVFGGADDVGSIAAIHFDGTNYVQRLSLDADGNLVITGTASVATPTAAEHVTRKDYVDSAVGGKVDKGGDEMTGSLGMGGNTIYGVANPTDGNHAATKQYVDESPANVEWQPADYGVQIWSYDPAHAVNSTNYTVGTYQVVRLKAPKAMTVTGVQLYFSGTAAAGLANAYVALYQNGTKLVQSTDQSTAWQSTGLKTTTIAPTTLTAGYVDVMFWIATATTTPTIAHAADTGQSLINGNLASANLRFATTTGNATTAPSTLGTKTSSSNSWWVALV